MSADCRRMYRNLKEWKNWSFQKQPMKATVLAESFDFPILSSLSMLCGNLHCQVGVAPFSSILPLLWNLTFFYFTFPGFPFYIAFTYNIFFGSLNKCVAITRRIHMARGNVMQFFESYLL